MPSSGWRAKSFPLAPFSPLFLKAALKTASNYLAKRLMAVVRRRLTPTLPMMYFNADAKLFYSLNELDRRLDNVDGRITNDVEFMLQDFTEFFFGGVREIDVQSGARIGSSTLATCSRSARIFNIPTL